MTHLDTELKELKPRLWHMPRDFDISLITTDRRLWKFREEFVYILGLIRWQKDMRFGRLRKRARIANVRLKAAYLRAVLGRHAYKPVMRALIACDAVTCDGIAWRGSRCFGYDLGRRFGFKYKETYITKPKLLKAMQPQDIERYEDLPLLDKWLRLNLERIQLDDEAYQTAATTKDIEHTEMTLRKIEAGEFFYIIDKYSRRHTNITNAPKTIRKHLTVDGQHLVSLDVSASQPLIIGLKMTAPAMPINDTRVVGAAAAVRNPVVRRRSASFYKSSSRGHPTPLTMDTLHDTKQPGMRQFLCDAERGLLYRKLAKAAAGKRNEAKLWLLRSIYYDPKRWQNRSLAASYPTMQKIIDLVRKHYPGVMEWIDKAKGRDYRKLSHDIQRSEAEVMYQMICNSIHRQRPEMFIATIHDAILCKQEDAAFVKNVMMQQFRTLGIQPTIKEKLE